MRRIVVGAVTILVLLTSAFFAAPAEATTPGDVPATPHGAGLALPADQAVPKQRFRANAAAALPETVDLTPWAVPAGDQGALNSCTAWSVGYTLAGWWASRAGRPTAFAPMYVYSQTHLSNTPDGGGAYLASAFGIETGQGVDTRAHYAHSSTDFSVPPTADETANAASYRLSGWQRLYASASGAPASAQNLIETSLAAGQPVVLGIPIYNQFYWLDESDHRLTASDASGPTYGYHAVVVLGYDAAGVTIENSWGDDWGDHGFAQLGWDFVLRSSVEADTATGPAAPPPDTGVPSWVTGVTTTVDTNTAIVRWRPPPSNGASITAYRVTRDGQDLAGGGPTSVDVDGDARSATFSNLFPSRRYSITVQALTATGGGEITTTTTSTAAATVPGAPTDLRAAARQDGRSADLSWTAPVDTGGWPIYQYRAVVTTAGSSSVQMLSTASPTTVGGLQPGTDYTVALSAVTAAGTGPGVVASVRTPDAAGAPTITSTTTTPTSASVAWTAPSGDVSGYRVGIGSTTVLLPADARSYTFSGLRAASSYTVTVVAFNGVGPSDEASATLATAALPPTAVTTFPTPSTTAPARPDPVRDVRLSWGADGSATVGWSGGSSAGTVHVLWSEQTGARDLVLASGEVTAPVGFGSVSIGGHPAGRAVELLVWTQDVDGARSVAAQLDDVVPEVPGAAPITPAPASAVPQRPASVTAHPSGSAVVVRWVAGSDVGTTTGWRVTVGSVVVVVSDPSARSVVVRHAARGIPLRVSVVAVSTAGSGRPTTTSVLVRRSPSAPRGLHAGTRAHRIVLHWAAPAVSGGRAIIAYRITRSGTDAGGRRQSPRTVRAGTRIFVLDGLRRRSTYTVTVRAVTRDGAGPAATVRAATR